MKTMRRGFTLIEILVSVLILSGAIVYVLKVHEQNHEQIVYISERNKKTLEDSLFLADKTKQYHKDTKSAYDLVSEYFRVDKFESRELLKKSERSIFIPEEIQIVPQEEMQGPAATVNEFKLKGEYSSTYFRFKINTF